MRQLLAGKYAGMDVAPTLWDLGKEFVVRPPNKVFARREAVINNEPPRSGDVAHVAIKHSDRCRCVLDEYRQLRLSFREVRFSLLAFADVYKHVDGTGQSSGRIEQRRWIGDEGNTRSVRPLSDRFHATDRPLLPQCHRHGAFMVWQRSAIRPIELP